MKHTFLSIAITLCFFSMSKAQEALLKNSIYLELGGLGGAYSINYERSFYFNTSFGLRAGIGFSPSLLDFEFSPRFPVRTILFYEIKNHVIESGLGITTYMRDYDIRREVTMEADIALLGQLGYRYNFKHSKGFAGIAFTPLLYEKNRDGILPWGAIKLGRRF